MNKILEVQHIEKSYRENKAVDDLSFMSMKVKYLAC